VTPSGSCAAMVHHWYERILDGDWVERARAVAGRTYELTSFLVDRLGATEEIARAAPLDPAVTVTVHDACHGLRVLGLKPSGRRLRCRWRSGRGGPSTTPTSRRRRPR